MEYLLGVDVGTTAIKVALFSISGKEMGVSSREYSLSNPTPSAVEVDPEVYWQGFRECLRELLSVSGVRAADIAAVCIVSQGETLIVLGSDGLPLRPALVWLDNRPMREAEELANVFHSEDIYRITGQADMLPTWTATKIRWLARNEPDVFARTTKYLLVADYMVYRLTGQFSGDYALYSTSLLLDIVNKKWWTEMLDCLGVGPQKLVELVEPGEVVGTVTDAAASMTGLRVGTRVVRGAMDLVAGALGAGNCRTGIINETTGTALTIVATTPTPVFDPNGRVPIQYHAVKGMYCLVPWCPTGGLALRWFRDRFCQQEVEIACHAGISEYELLTKQAESVPAGSEGLVFLPYLSGAGSPDFDPGAKGAFVGLTLGHGRGHFIRAIMEGVAYTLKANLDVLEGMGIGVTEIRALGGGAKSPLWNSIKASICGRKVITVQAAEEAAVGAVILAGVGVGAFDSVPAACDAIVKIDSVYEPSEADRVAYQAGFRRYQETAAAIRPTFKENGLGLK